jgi:hypothetical protein
MPVRVGSEVQEVLRARHRSLIGDAVRAKTLSSSASFSSLSALHSRKSHLEGEPCWRCCVALNHRAGVLNRKWEMAMEEDVSRPPTAPEELQEAKRNEALARYDAHPGIAIIVLAVMALLFIVLVYEFASARLDSGANRHAEVEHVAWRL